MVALLPSILMFIIFIAGLALTKRMAVPGSRKQIWLISVFVSLILVLAASFTSCRGEPSMSFENIGQDKTGTIVYLTLTSTGNITDQALGERLKADWQDKMVKAGEYDRITVVVFDNKDAAKRMVEIAMQGLTLDVYNKESAWIFPHIITAYHRDTAKGDHASYFYARDARMTLVNKIQYSNAK